MIHEQYHKAQMDDQRDQMDEQPHMACSEELLVNFRESTLEQADQITVTEIECMMPKLGKKTLSALSCLSSPMMRLNSSPR